MSSLKREFERIFANFVGVRYSLAVSSGRNAIYLVLKSFISSGDEVILPSFVCKSVLVAVKESGATPVLVDINKDLTVDLAEIKKKISEKTKAVLLVHIYGRSSKVDLIKSFCRERNVVLIEDCAQALGSKYKDQVVGSFGDFAIYSLTKNMSNSGGGVIVTDNQSAFEKVISLKRNIQRRKSLFSLPYLSFKYIASSYESKGSNLSKYIIKFVSFGAKKLLNQGSDDGLSNNFECSNSQMKRALKYIKSINNEFEKRKRIYSYLKDRLGKKYVLPFVPQESDPFHLYFPLGVDNPALKKKMLRKINILSESWKNLDESINSSFISEHMVFFPIGSRFNKMRLDYLSEKLLEL
jgi:dTDP-4-amino-4,6-dideoxygalactose transaminase